MADPASAPASDGTPTAILDAAEDLFARQGYDGTSVREITRAAGVNVAAVHYHFGAKDALLRAVTDRVVEPLNAQRFGLLDVLEAAGDPPALRAVMEAFVRPDITAIQRLGLRGPRVARFLGRTYSDQTPWIREMAQDQFGAAGSRFLPLLAAAAPHLGTDEVRWRLEQVVAVVVHTFATWPEAPLTDRAAEHEIARLVAFTTGAMGAPATGPRRKGGGGGTR